MLRYPFRCMFVATSNCSGVKWISFCHAELLLENVDNLLEGHQRIFLYESIWIPWDEHVFPKGSAASASKFGLLELCVEGFSFSQIRFFLNYMENHSQFQEYPVEGWKQIFAIFWDDDFKSFSKAHQIHLKNPVATTQAQANASLKPWKSNISNGEPCSLLVVSSEIDAWTSPTCSVTVLFPWVWKEKTHTLKKSNWLKLPTYCIINSFISSTDSSHINPERCGFFNSMSIQKHNFFDAATWQVHCSHFDEGIQLMEVFIPKTEQGICILPPNSPSKTKKCCDVFLGFSFGKWINPQHITG